MQIIRELVCRHIMVPSQKPKTLSLEEKFQLVRAHEQENLSVGELQSIFNCGKTQIYEILKRSEDFREPPMASNRKRFNVAYPALPYEDQSCLHKDSYYIQNGVNMKQELRSASSTDGQSCNSSTSYQPEYDYIESGYYEREIRNYREALDHIKALQEFALRVNNRELLNGTFQLRSIAEKKIFKQTSLLDYWVPLNNNN